MITEFKDTYRWLSNFEPVYVKMDGKRYPSVEHAYQAAKSNDAEWRKFCRQEPSAGMVKRRARQITKRADWDAVKVNIMRELLMQKYSIEPFRSLLAETGNVYLIEGNTWSDTFWGVDIRTGEGKNVLGFLLMDIREDLSQLPVTL